MDVSVVALALHEETNFNVPQHAIEEFMQQQPGGGGDEFKGCHMLAEVENTESSGVGSWTRLQWR
jgi:hypothetical protein